MFTHLCLLSVFLNASQCLILLNLDESAQTSKLLTHKEDGGSRQMPLMSERAQGRACVEHGLAMKILEMALSRICILITRPDVYL